MTVAPPGIPCAASSLSRRKVLFGLAAAQLWRVVTRFGLTFPVLTRHQAFANTLNTEGCDPPSSSTASWAAQRRARLGRALRTGFGVQYWGDTFTVSYLAAAPHGALIIETAKIGASISNKNREVFFSADEIRQIGHDGRRPVFGYLNMAKIEPYRDYWVDTVVALDGGDTQARPDAAWIGPSLGKDGTLARFWTPEWAAILADRVDRLLSLGVDGLFLDDVLQYYAYYKAVAEDRPGFAAPGGPMTAGDFARAMMNLVIAVCSRARQNHCGTLVVVNNGVFIGRDAGEDPTGSQRLDTFDHYRSVIDAVLIESVFAAAGNAPAISALHEDFASSGITVLTIDFADAAKGATPAETKSTITDRAAHEGFAAYVAEDRDD